MAKIAKIQGREILNSKGEPTVEVKVLLDNGFYGISAAPTGASVSQFEAIEVRDGDLSRFAGLGVTKAVDNVVNLVGPKLQGVEIEDQGKIDEILIQLDGTPNKSRLGVNTVLPVSQAALAAAAASAQTPLWKYINQKFFSELTPTIPTPIFNLINGGKHGAQNLDFQEFLVIPVSARLFTESLEMGVAIYYSLKKVLAAKHHVFSLGDEGGFAPELATNAEAFEILMEAVTSTGYMLTRDIFLGLDAAASNLVKDQFYIVKDRSSPQSVQDMIEYYKELIKRFHLLILEDGLAEDDWQGWRRLTAELGDQLIIVGDDLLATNPKRIEEANKLFAVNAILVKPNQIGTISETIGVISTCQKFGWKIIISHRSGETNDTFIADLAVAAATDYVKFGAPARGERVAKYNRLLEIYLSLTG